MPLGRPVTKCLVSLGLIPNTPGLKKKDWPAIAVQVSEGLDQIVALTVEEDGCSEGTVKSIPNLKERAAGWLEQHGPSLWPNFQSNRPM